MLEHISRVRSDSPARRTAESPAENRGRATLTVLAGPGYVLDLARPCRAGDPGGRTVLYVDGANAFDPYILSRLAREAGRPPGRSCSACGSPGLHLPQLETLLVERLPEAIARFHPAWSSSPAGAISFTTRNVRPARRSACSRGVPAGCGPSPKPASRSWRSSRRASDAAPATARRDSSAHAADVFSAPRDGSIFLAVCEKPTDSRGARPLQAACERELPFLRAAQKPNVVDKLIFAHQRKNARSAYGPHRAPQRVLEAEFESWNKFRRALRRRTRTPWMPSSPPPSSTVAAMVYASRLTPWRPS